MFREMRKKEREILKDDIVKILDHENYGIFSVTGENGYAYGVPVNYVYLNEAIYFHCANVGFKIDSLRKNPKTSFTVVGSVQAVPEKFTTKYESVIAFGEAKEISGAEKIEVLKAFINKYSSEFTEEGMKYIERAHEVTNIVKIEIHYITGKARS
ncbi:pyridoxamine 5'-phosphate oxidase family protein [Clostridium sp. 'White wine YQ']|uniref:pyridoxamine 5'-phosphate oxidase family protein n=1 Tax=Clostridium sp. 'White wine YQ' TaxID=3027474 RepID=UPI00236625E3|nr:pyridoxamine 5'-phosphate oxidase family protein [Clostridium sp. 'White wine YQ']MDD7792784.1 pyridoxamine 5'-phosphate oxidase family protein [Clostridium sp. 'White wine YQ']